MLYTSVPLSFSRQQLSYGGGLKVEYYQNCSVPCCVAYIQMWAILKFTYMFNWG